MASKLTPAQVDDLRRAPITVYSPGQATFDRYGPLVRDGLLDVEDIGSDEMQETIHRFTVTPAGLSALRSMGETNG